MHGRIHLKTLIGAIVLIAAIGAGPAVGSQGRRLEDERQDHLDARCGAVLPRQRGVHAVDGLG